MAADWFDQAAREIATGTSRRGALRLLGGIIAAGLLGLVSAGPVAADNALCRPAGKTCRGHGIPCCNNAVCCGEVCCAAGQVCDATGVCVTPPPPPPPPGGPNRQICICIDGTLINVCATLNCDSSAEQDAICGPACADHLGESGTGCITDDPMCTA